MTEHLWCLTADSVKRFMLLDRNLHFNGGA